MRNRKKAMKVQIAENLFGIKDAKFPKHLTPEIIATALFIYNAPDNTDVPRRVEQGCKKIGDEAMSYAMALLVLPELQKLTMKSDEYQEWLTAKNKSNKQNTVH
jgi:hypothetical protein